MRIMPEPLFPINPKARPNAHEVFLPQKRLSSDFVKDSESSFLPSQIHKNNQLLEEQLRVSQLTTTFSTRSNILKALFDTLKTIGSNIR